MTSFISLADAEAALNEYIPESRIVTGQNISVQRMRGLMEALGNPHERLRIIHVAGTSGKTSTAYYIAAMLQAAGKHVGLTVSPHIDGINERVQVNLEPLPEADFCRELGEFLEMLERYEPRPTYFELLIAFALWYFDKIGVDYAVVETGIGGLHDGTNVAQDPDKICIITEIGYDHTDLLGNSLKEIAGQKAGIIHAGNHTFMHGQSPEIDGVVRARADKVSATLHIADPDTINGPTSKESLGGLPIFQRRNWTLAYEAFRYVCDRDEIAMSDTQLKATTGTTIPGRMERRTLDGKDLIIDGAHNGQKMNALAESVQTAYPGVKAAVLLCVKKGLSYKDVMQALQPITSKLIISSLRPQQDLPADDSMVREVASLAANGGFDRVIAEPDIGRAVQSLKESEEELLVATGSFHLVAYLHRAGIQ
jgi:dihydrofolate synthase/folylpolyglutamate synthase